MALRRRRSREVLRDPEPLGVRARRWLFAVIGIALIAAGVAVVAVPLYGVWHRSREDSKALNEWNSGGSKALTGALPAGHGEAPAGATPCNAGAAPRDDYALVTFPSLSFGYAEVAGDSGWDGLHDRSMVHYHDSPAPGQQGNVIIAFHREPGFEHIDQLKEGDPIAVQDRACHTYTYHVTQRWVGPPDKVTQLVTTSGHDLTLVTCTPWYQDNDRIVWRAVLAG